MLCSISEAHQSQLPSKSPDKWGDSRNDEKAGGEVLLLEFSRLDTTLSLDPGVFPFSLHTGPLGWGRDPPPKKIFAKAPLNRSLNKGGQLMRGLGYKEVEIDPFRGWGCRPPAVPSSLHQREVQLIVLEDQVPCRVP